MPTSRATRPQSRGLFLDRVGRAQATRRKPRCPALQVSDFMSISVRWYFRSRAYSSRCLRSILIL